MLRKKIKNLVVYAVTLWLSLNCFSSLVYAASISLSAWDNGNGTYSISVSSPYIGGVNVSTTYGNVQFWCEGSCIVTAGSSTIKGTGSVSITASPLNPMSNSDGDKVTVSGASTYINVKNPNNNITNKPNTDGNSSEVGQNNNSSNNKAPQKQEKKNSDSALASLSVSDGKLSPSFSAGTTSYKVSLPSTASSIKISASARDAKASVSGTGTRELEPGNNKLSVVCSAEDGSSTTYTINVYVDEKPLTYVTYNGMKLGVSARSDKGAKLSKAFDETKIKMNGIEVPAWKNDALKITLVYLQSEGTQGYYMYDETKQEIVSVYEPVAVLGQNVVRIDIPENLQKREGMNFTKVKVDGKEFPGWTFEDKNLENYALIYVMNDAGKYEYYQYEKTQNTMQLYSGSAPISQEAYVKNIETMEKQLDNSKLLNVILGVAAGIFAVGMIASIVLASKRKNTSLKYEKVNLSAKKMSKASNIEADNLINKLDKLE